jgi:hypothetical protein
MKDNAMYKVMSERYPDLDSLFDKAVTDKLSVAGNFIRVQVSSGQIIYFIMIKTIDKFQAYLLNVTKSIRGVTDSIVRELGTEGKTNKVLFPMPTGDDLKLSDSIMIPTICDSLNIKGIEVFIASNGDHEQYIETITDKVIYYKRDSWNNDWMLTTDDILLVDIISQVITLAHNYKLGKSNLVKCYQICNKHGMFGKIEWYQTEYGQFFKLFNPKCHGMINHGLLMNVNHYSKVEPPRMSLILGPSFLLLKHLAYTKMYESRPITSLIAKEIYEDYLEALNKKPEGVQSYQKSQPRSEQPSFKF